MRPSRLPEAYVITGMLLLAGSLVGEAWARPLQLLYAHRPEEGAPAQPWPPADSSSSPPPPPPMPGTDQDAAVGGCLCPATLQYDPVCGTDNQTYNSLELLYCAQRCGRNVQLSFKGRCSPIAG